MNKKIENYVENEGWELKHSVDALSYAAIKTANPAIIFPAFILVGHFLF